LLVLHNFLLSTVMTAMGPPSLPVRTTVSTWGCGAAQHGMPQHITAWHVRALRIVGCDLQLAATVKIGIMRAGKQCSRGSGVQSRSNSCTSAVSWAASSLQTPEATPIFMATNSGCTIPADVCC
jgi:hypothetical protein